MRDRADGALAAQDATPAEVAAAHRCSDAQRVLMARGASHDEHLDLSQRLPPALERFGAFAAISRDRWRFASLDTGADATRALSDLRDTPVLLQLGVHDVHVDVADTERAHLRAPTLGCLEVAHHPDADHSLVRADMAEHPALLSVWALWQPRDVLADGVLADIQRFAGDPRC